jgi:hypothetical protein
MQEGSYNMIFNLIRLSWYGWIFVLLVSSPKIPFREIAKLRTPGSSAQTILYDGEWYTTWANEGKTAWDVGRRGPRSKSRPPLSRVTMIIRTR